MADMATPKRISQRIRKRLATVSTAVPTLVMSPEPSVDLNASITSPAWPSRAEEEIEKKGKREKETVKYKQWSKEEVLPEVDMLMRLTRNPCDLAEDGTECRCQEPCRAKDFYAMEKYVQNVDSALNAPDKKVSNNIREFLKKRDVAFCNSCASLGAARNSPHIDIHAENEAAIRRTHGRSRLSRLMTSARQMILGEGCRHPPGPQEFFRMNGSHTTFENAIGMDVKMLELINVDESDGTFELKFELTVSWYDKMFDLEHYNPHTKTPMDRNIKVTSYCAPKVTIKDVLEGDDGWVNHQNVAEGNLCWKDGVSDDTPGLRGVVFKTMEQTCTVRDDNPVHAFPFDQQELTVEFEMPESASRDTKDYNRYFVPLNVGVEAQHDHDHMDWNAHRAVAHITKPAGEQQHLVCVFRVTRKPWHHVFSVILVVFLMSILGALSFVIPLKEVGDRSSVTLALLLALIEFKKFVGDKTPVSYLTFLDWYTLSGLFMIFWVAFENLIIASWTGVEYTASCSRQLDDNRTSAANNTMLPLTFPQPGQNVSIYLHRIFAQLTRLEKSLQQEREDKSDCMVPTATGQDAMPDPDAVHKMGLLEYAFGNEYEPLYKGGSMWYIEAISWEAAFQRYTILLFILMQGMFAFKAFRYILQRMRKCGPVLTRKMQQEAEKMFSGKSGTLQEINKTLKEVRPETEEIKTELWEVREESMSYEHKELHAAIANAGLGLKLPNVVSVLLEAWLDVPQMKETDDAVLLKLLGERHIKLEDCIKLMVAARNQVDLIFLQGSASYLFKDLGIDGQLVTKAVCLERMQERFRRNVHTDQDAFVSLDTGDAKKMDVGSDHLDHDLKSFANMIYGHLLMNSTATPTVAFLSQRECEGLDGKIYTQLWAGFAAKCVESLPAGEDERKIVVVDLGTGEFKRFLCKVRRGKAIEKVEEKKDKSTAEAYSKGLEKMFDDIKKSNEEKFNNNEAVDPDGPELDVYKDSLSKVVNAILGNGIVEAFIKKHGGIKPHGGVTAVHFLATSSTRKILSKPLSGKAGRPHERKAANFARIFILKAVKEKLAESLGGNNDDAIDFKLLDQKDEAHYEFHAAKAAIKYAIDIPAEAKSTSSFAALAWGNGSCQGYCYGDVEAPGNSMSSTPKRVLSMEVGLEEVQSQIIVRYGGKDNIYSYDKDKGEAEIKAHVTAHVEKWCRETGSEETGSNTGVDAIIYKKKKTTRSWSTRIRFQNPNAILELRRAVEKDLAQKMRKQKSAIQIKFFETA